MWFLGARIQHVEDFIEGKTPGAQHRLRSGRETDPGSQSSGQSLAKHLRQQCYAWASQWALDTHRRTYALTYAAAASPSTPPTASAPLFLASEGRSPFST